MSSGRVDPQKFAEKLRERPDLYTEEDIKKAIEAFREFGLITTSEEEEKDPK